jgi:hypothetical protein
MKRKRIIAAAIIIIPIVAHALATFTEPVDPLRHWDAWTLDHDGARFVWWTAPVVPRR